MAIEGAALLVVDPDSSSSEQLASDLRRVGARVTTCAKGAEALALLNSGPADIVLTELLLPDMGGLELITLIAERWPGLPVLVVARDASVADAVAALKTGAADFIERPYDAEQLSFVANKALASVRLSASRPPPPTPSARASILGASPAMLRTHATLARAAPGTSTVLIRGETGTGKELVARAIHDASPRADHPFIKIDCASLPESLLESELFGYEKGAFTGATSRKPGRVELADKGTLFLDEIGELTLPLQAKLLRLLQDRQFERLGGTKAIPVDVRVLAATHRDLEGMIDRQQFRLDLFYRLNVVPLWLPPLRARRDDIELLASHFAHASSQLNGQREVRLTAAALALLRSQRWPGNVRQLQNFVERLVVLATGPEVSAEQVQAELAAAVNFRTESTALPGAIAGAGLAMAAHQGAPAPEESVELLSAKAPVAAQVRDASSVPIVPLDAAMRQAERNALEAALAYCQGNRSQAARLLGVSRSTLYAKLREHGLVEAG